MKIVDVIDRNTGLLEELTALWLQSVAQTHTFLTNKDIDEIENYVPQALKEVEHLSVVICHLVYSCAPLLKVFCLFFFPSPSIFVRCDAKVFFSPGLRKRKQLR